MEERLKAVCSGYYGFGNFGDEAVLSVLTEMFSKHYDLTVLSSNPENTSSLYNVKSLYSFDYVNVFNQIKESDVLISGGGSLLQDVTSFKSLLYYLLLIYIAILYKKKIFIFAQGMGPFKSRVSEILVSKALRQCSLITVRDDESYSLLKKWGIPSLKVVDPVYNLPIPKLTKKRCLGVQLRNFPTLTQDFLVKLAGVINQEFVDYDVVLYSLQTAIDLDICNKFSKMLNVKNVIVKSDMSISETIDELSSLEYLIAMRFHSALIGLKAGVRVLPIVYDKKVRILAQEVGVKYLEFTDTDIQQKFIDLKTKYPLGVENILKDKKLDVEIFDI